MVISTLASTLSIPAEGLAAKIDKDKFFTWVARKVPQGALPGAARQKNLPGVGFVKESKRFYPNKSLAGPYHRLCGH